MYSTGHHGGGGSRTRYPPLQPSHGPLSPPQLAARSTRSYPGPPSPLCILEVTRYLLLLEPSPTRCEAGGKYRISRYGAPQSIGSAQGCVYFTKVAQGTQSSCGLSGPQITLYWLLYYHTGHPGTNACYKGKWSTPSLGHIQQSRAECVNRRIVDLREYIYLDTCM